MALRVRGWRKGKGKGKRSGVLRRSRGYQGLGGGVYNCNARIRRTDECSVDGEHLVQVTRRMRLIAIGLVSE